MGLWHPPAVLLKQVCVFGRHFCTHRRGACTQIYISVSYVAAFLWTDPVPHWSKWEVGKAYKPTHGSTNLHEHILVLKQATVLSRLQPFPLLLLYFSVRKHCMYFASLRCSLRYKKHISVSALCSLSTWGRKWQALGTDGAQHTPGKSSWSVP